MCACEISRRGLALVSAVYPLAFFLFLFLFLSSFFLHREQGGAVGTPVPCNSTFFGSSINWVCPKCRSWFFNFPHCQSNYFHFSGSFRHCIDLHLVSLLWRSKSKRTRTKRVLIWTKRALISFIHSARAASSLARTSRWNVDGSLPAPSLVVAATVFSVKTRRDASVPPAPLSRDLALLRFQDFDVALCTIFLLLRSYHQCLIFKYLHSFRFIDKVVFKIFAKIRQFFFTECWESCNITV